jgi:ribonuclease H / adenosylcobalamin/alpha-ribazole phosphatase
LKGRVICDGRGNGGTGARAAVLFVEERLVDQRAEKLDATTNIVAEHRAIQLAMELAAENGVTDLLIWNDSQSPVKHIRGEYKVREAHLKPIVEQTNQMRSQFEAFAIEWVPRTKTKLADALCREVDPPN